MYKRTNHSLYPLKKKKKEKERKQAISYHFNLFLSEWNMGDSESETHIYAIWKFYVAFVAREM